MAQGTKRGAATRFFQSVASTPDQTDECIIWPFARQESGYAVFGKARGAIRSAIVSRVMCGEVHGLPPTADHEAAHTCGNGNLGCVNPKHLVWKTSKQNKADQIAHGTRNYGERNGRSRLSAEQIVRIRGLAQNNTQSSIAKAFGIDPSTVSDIVNRHRWGHIQ